MQRFSFSDITLGNDITISEDSFIHQISRVLRIKNGERVILFNGDGQEYMYIIESIEKKGIKLSFSERYKNISETAVYIRLYQAIPNKYEKIEHIIQKWVEVWIQEFIFFKSERSQNLIISDRKAERFQEIAKEATEQCYGSKIPTIHFLEEKIPSPQDGQSYLFHTQKIGTMHLQDINTEISPINIFVGPEWGWSDKEVDIFETKNIHKVCLWDRILRTETVGPVVSFFLITK